MNLQFRSLGRFWIGLYAIGMAAALFAASPACGGCPPAFVAIFALAAEEDTDQQLDMIDRVEDEHSANMAADTAKPTPVPAIAPNSGNSLPPEPEQESQRQGHVDPEDVRLRFSFRYQPWEDVLDWLAEQADLSLQSDVTPRGTFNYTDAREFTPTEAIDLINGVLLTKGFTIVRRGRLLTLIDLENAELPDVLLERVPIEKLDERGEFEFIKVIFQMDKLATADAEKEIGPLLGPDCSMVIMPESRQIVVTATAGKLRMIRDVIDRAESLRAADDTSVTEVVLSHVHAEDVMRIARPFLGLDADENVADDISLATGFDGRRIFVRGVKEKVAIFKDLVVGLDRSVPIELSTPIAQLQVLTHPISLADPDEVLAVIQTLLAGSPDVRVSLDRKTRKIIALAELSEHKTIQETIRQLDGEAACFEVIPLCHVDPRRAVAVVRGFYGTDEDGIRVDADPTTMKLFVLATKSEIEHIRTLIAKLEDSSGQGAVGGTVRHIPLARTTARAAVETARRFWSETNDIQISEPSESAPSMFELRHVLPGDKDVSGGSSARRSKAPPAAGDYPPKGNTKLPECRTEPQRLLAPVGPVRIVHIEGTDLLLIRGR